MNRLEYSYCMRLLLQRVSKASVSVDQQIVGKIVRGYLLLLCVMQGDTSLQAQWLAEKIVKLRLFDAENGKVNDRSILDISGEILIVSQFTLAGDVSRGSRPDYTAAAKPQEATVLYEYFMRKLKELGIAKVESGVFGEEMEVSLTNDGPVTIFLEK